MHFSNFVEENSYKIQYRVMLARTEEKLVCPDCKGSRLKKEAGNVKVGGKSLQELVLMLSRDLRIFFTNLKLSEHDEKISGRLLKEINNRP
jgi:excinuclease ABC subunit A